MPRASRSGKSNDEIDGMFVRVVSPCEYIYDVIFGIEQQHYGSCCWVTEHNKNNQQFNQTDNVNVLVRAEKSCASVPSTHEKCVHASQLHKDQLHIIRLKQAW